MRHILIVLIAIITTFGSMHTANAENPIGTITVIDGTITKTMDSADITLSSQDPIFLNDDIMSDANGLAHIKFIDDTEITISNNTHLVIDEYVFEPEDASANKAEFSITKGAFHYVSGLIAKKEEPDVTIKLDFGSIGIRGTKIWRDIKPDENGDPMCRVYVEDGVARVHNDMGFTMLKHGDGTKIRGLRNAPTAAKPWKQKAIDDIKAQTAFTEIESSMDEENSL